MLRILPEIKETVYIFLVTCRIPTRKTGIRMRKLRKAFIICSEEQVMLPIDNLLKALFQSYLAIHS